MMLNIPGSFSTHLSKAMVQMLPELCMVLLSKAVAHFLVHFGLVAPCLCLVFSI